MAEEEQVVMSERSRAEEKRRGRHLIRKVELTRAALLEQQILPCWAGRSLATA
jgi:hypothetical protein